MDNAMRPTRRLVAALLLAVMSCGAQSQTTVPQAHADATSQRLVIADGQGDWGILAPFLHQARGPGYVYTSFLFDTLVWKDTDGKLAPALAIRWQALPGERCHRFTLAPNAHWHDGEPVTVQDVAFSFRYLRQHQYRFVDLQGIDSVVTNDDTVTICTKQPYAPFMTNIAAALPIVPAHVYGKVDAPQQFHALQAATGSGPYRLAAYDRARGHYRLARHTGYHGAPPRYDEVYLVKMNPQLALAAMQRGEVHAATIPALLAESFRKAGMRVLSQPSNHPYRLLFNHQGRFADVRLRHGLAHALDRQWLVDAVYHGQASLARIGYRQDGAPVDLPAYAFDPLRAAKLLQSAGWVRNAAGDWQQDGADVVLQMLSDPASEVLAKAVAAQLEAFGAQVRLRLEQDVPLNQRLRAKDFDIALLSSSHEGDPDRFRLVVMGQQQRADDYHADPELLDVLQRQMHVMDATQRDVLLAEAERRYGLDLPAYLLVNPFNFVAYDPARVTPAFTQQGIAMGIPLPWNRAALFRPPSDGR